MKIDQHPFPTNRLDAKGKTKILTLEIAEKNASVDPQHQVTTDDAKGKGLLKENGNFGRLLGILNINTKSRQFSKSDNGAKNAKPIPHTT